MDIYSMTRAGLENWFKSLGENPAKAEIVFDYIYRRGISDLGELPFSGRVIGSLKAGFTMSLPEAIEKSEQPDSVKLLLRLGDGCTVESVLMRQKYGASVCISTQVGCSMGCAFCQSGRLKCARSLTAGEMTAQVLKMKAEYGSEIHSVTVMGIGEPFNNFDAVRDFCEIASDYKGLALGEKHITVSTCGIIPGIRAWAELPHPCNLAISLHCADDTLRSRLMPVNRSYPVKDTVNAAREFAERHNRRVTLEYIMLKGINDSTENARQLAELIGADKHFYVNLIPCNASDAGFAASEREQIAAFYDVLKRAGVSVTMRRKFGTGINAACGQLKASLTADG